MNRELFCICFCTGEVLKASSSCERRAGPQCQLCKPGIPRCPRTSCPLSSFTDTLWHPAAGDSSSLSVAGCQEGNRASFVSSPITNGLRWTPAMWDWLLLPGHIHTWRSWAARLGAAGEVTAQKWLGETMPGARWRGL